MFTVPPGICNISYEMRNISSTNTYTNYPNKITFLDLQILNVFLSSEYLAAKFISPILISELPPSQYFQSCLM